MATPPPPSPPPSSSSSSTTQTIPLSQTIEIPPWTGRAFQLRKGQRLTVTDPRGCHVSDLLAYNAHDVREVISSGRTLDYASRLFLTVPDLLYSNHSNVMLRIVQDTCGRHDLFLMPLSADTFRIIYGHEEPHCGCFGKSVEGLAPFGVEADAVPVPFYCL